MAQSIKTFSFVRIILKYTGLFCLVSAILIVVTSPNPGEYQDQNPKQTAFMELRKNSKATPPKPIKFVPISQISPQLIKAILSSEDDLFFKHHGFNTTEMIKAFWANLKKARLSRGGSTLTQQLARNLYLSPTKSIVRKIREAYITFLIELNLSKTRILELYLNTAQFGPGIYGAEQAALYHFGTRAKFLSSSQAALLAAMLPRPSVYGKKPYPGKTYARQRRILKRMHKYALHLPQSIQKRVPVVSQKKKNEEPQPKAKEKTILTEDTKEHIEELSTEIDFQKKTEFVDDDFNEF